MTVLPYKNSADHKKKQVALMFDNIAGKYDLLNGLLSMNIDKIWRNKAIKCLRAINPKNILDVATGTGDFSICALQLNPDKVTGIDISTKMLEIGRLKVAKKNLSHKIEFQVADSENLPFADFTFDAATVGFGVRNFEDPGKGLSEIYRVLHNGGQLVVLEFSKPVHFPINQLYRFYFTRILPFIGRLISKDKSAYNYLPDSVMSFPDGQQFVDMLGKAGFVNCAYKPVTVGIATIYTGYKQKA